MPPRDPLRRTELHHACAGGDVARIRALLQSGASANVSDAAGWTPLHFAAQARSALAAELLIRAGAAVDPLDDHGNSPLVRAVFESRGDEQVIEVLLAAGADPHRQNRYGVSPLSLAHTIENYDVAKFFPNSR